jgi:hypothetical protein
MPPPLRCQQQLCQRHQHSAACNTVVNGHAADREADYYWPAVLCRVTRAMGRWPSAQSCSGRTDTENSSRRVSSEPTSEHACSMPPVSTAHCTLDATSGRLAAVCRCMLVSSCFSWGAWQCPNDGANAWYVRLCISSAQTDRLHGQEVFASKQTGVRARQAAGQHSVCGSGDAGRQRLCVSPHVC